MFRIIFNPFSGLHTQTESVFLQPDNTAVRNNKAIEMITILFFITTIYEDLSFLPFHRHIPRPCEVRQTESEDMAMQIYYIMMIFYPFTPEM